MSHVNSIAVTPWEQYYWHPHNPLYAIKKSQSHSQTPAHWPYLTVSHTRLLPLATMPPGNHACPPPNTHPLATTHSLQPCTPPSNHACLRQPHTPLGNHTHPLATTHTPWQPCTPPTTMHAPLATTHVPPCGQNHRRLWKYNLAPTSLRVVKIAPCERAFMKKSPCLFASYFCLHHHPPEIKTVEVKFTEVKTLRFSQRKSKYKRQAWRHREFRDILNKRYQFKRNMGNLHIFGIVHLTQYTLEKLCNSLTEAEFCWVLILPDWVAMQW